MPKVRQTAALVEPCSSAAITAPSFSGSMTTGRPPTRPRRCEAGLDPLLRQGALKLCQGTEDMKQKLALWGWREP